MNSVRHRCRQQTPTNKNEEKENGYMQEPNRKLLGIRWKIESGFKEIKQEIGSSKSQTSDVNAVINHVNFFYDGSYRETSA
jgi:hypothetical protein